MTSILDLKNSSISSIQDLQQQLENANKKNTKERDERFWVTTPDKSGSASAVFRFLPAPKGESVPWVLYYDHGFKGPGGWYIEKSLTTIGQKDPVSELNGKYWNNGTKEGQDIARSRKRRTHYVSNILMIDDPANPDNNGKVFLFQYGKTIYDHVKNILMPPQTGLRPKKPSNPFDMWTGRNFVFEMRKEDGFVNYKSSEWDEPSAIFASDDLAQYEDLWSKCYSLQEFLNPSSFKSYQELQDRLNKVLGGENNLGSVVSSVVSSPSNRVEEDEEPEEEPEAEQQLDFLQRLANKVV